MARVHAETVEGLLEAETIDKADVDIVGCHGQTVPHRSGWRG